MYFRKKASLVLCIAITLMMAITPAWAMVCNNDGELSLQYVKTQRITATLTLQNGVANCKGKLCPRDGQDCSITVTLYKKNGSSWNLVQSWSVNASGGAYAIVSKTCSVEPGTYKVVSVGLVDGEETTKESPVKTY